MTESDILSKYKHITIRKAPYEDEIIDVIDPEVVDFSNRKDFLNSLYLITKKGYYAKVGDFFGSYAIPMHEWDDDEDFCRYLYGIKEMAYVLAYRGSREGSCYFFKSWLCENNSRKLVAYQIQSGPYKGRFSFTWAVAWYQYIPKECEKN